MKQTNHGASSNESLVTSGEVPSSSVAELVSQLREERELMMSHWRGVENAMHRYILALVSLIGGFTYFYFKGEWGIFAIPREWMLFSLVQIAFLSFLFIVSAFSAIGTYSGYIRALEDRINVLSRIPTAVWVGGVWKRFTARPYGAFFWCWLIIDVVGTVALIGVMITFIVSSSMFWAKDLTILEIPVCVILILWALSDLERSEKFSHLLMLGEWPTKR